MLALVVLFLCSCDAVSFVLGGRNAANGASVVATSDDDGLTFVVNNFAFAPVLTTVRAVAFSPELKQWTLCGGLSFPRGPLLASASDRQNGPLNWTITNNATTYEYCTGITWAYLGPTLIGFWVGVVNDRLTPKQGVAYSQDGANWIEQDVTSVFGLLQISDVVYSSFHQRLVAVGYGMGTAASPGIYHADARGLPPLTWVAASVFDAGGSPSLVIAFERVTVSPVTGMFVAGFG